MPDENPYRLYTREQLEQEATRNQKIVVTLFLFLGKAVTALSVPQRKIQVSESEIRKAWTEKKSPVRIISEVLPDYTHGYDVETGEALNSINERVYKIHLQELDLLKVKFMHHGQKCPPHEASTQSADSNSHEPKKGRVFDLE